MFFVFYILISKYNTILEIYYRFLSLIYGQTRTYLKAFTYYTFQTQWLHSYTQKNLIFTNKIIE